MLKRSNLQLPVQIATGVCCCSNTGPWQLTGMTRLQWNVNVYILPTFWILHILWHEFMYLVSNIMLICVSAILYKHKPAKTEYPKHPSKLLNIRYKHRNQSSFTPNSLVLAFSTNATHGINEGHLYLFIHDIISHSTHFSISLYWISPHFNPCFNSITCNLINVSADSSSRLNSFISFKTTNRPDMNKNKARMIHKTHSFSRLYSIHVVCITYMYIINEVTDFHVAVWHIIPCLKSKWCKHRQCLFRPP